MAEFQTLCNMKLKIITLYAFLAISSQIQAQNGKLRLGVSFSPDICYRTLVNHSGTSDVNDAIKTQNLTNLYKLGFSAGVSLDYAFNDKYSLATGIQYSDKGYQTSEYLVASHRFPGPWAYEHKVYHIQYIDVPIMLKKHLKLNDRNRLNLSAGLCNSFYIGNYTKDIKKQDNKRIEVGRYSERNVGFNSYVPGVMASIGFEHKVNEQWSMKFEPTFKTQIGSMNNGDMHCLLYSFGLNFGVSFPL